jgi:hypothetical protein
MGTGQRVGVKGSSQPRGSSSSSYQAPSFWRCRPPKHVRGNLLSKALKFPCSYAPPVPPPPPAPRPPHRASRTARTSRPPPRAPQASRSRGPARGRQTRGCAATAPPSCEGVGGGGQRGGRVRWGHQAACTETLPAGGTHPAPLPSSAPAFHTQPPSPQPPKPPGPLALCTRLWGRTRAERCARRQALRSPRPAAPLPRRSPRRRPGRG